MRETQVAGRSLSLFLPRRMENLFVEREGADEEVPYWARLWPAAELAADAVLSFAPWPVGSDVLELGSGIGLVGLAARLRGDRVRFSDISEGARMACERSARRNGWSDTPAIHLDWRVPSGLQASVILACDILYDPSLHEPLLRTIDEVLEPDGICWVADPGRTSSFDFAVLATERFRVRLFDQVGEEALVPSRTRFQIFELRRPAECSP